MRPLKFIVLARHRLASFSEGFDREEIGNLGVQRFGDLERQNEARAVLPALEITDRLVMNANRVGKLLTGHTLADSQLLNPVKYGIFFLSAHGEKAYMLCSMNAILVNPLPRKA